MTTSSTDKTGYTAGAQLDSGCLSFSPSDAHWRFSLGIYRETVTRKQLRHVLLNCPDPIYQGRLHTWKSKYRGAGICELFISEELKNGSL